MASAAVMRPGQLGESWWTVVQVPHGLAFAPPYGLKAAGTGVNENVECRDEVVAPATRVATYAMDTRRALAPFGPDAQWQELAIPPPLLPARERTAFTARFTMNGEVFYQAHAYVAAGTRIGTVCWTCQDERQRSLDRFWHILSCLHYAEPEA